MQRFIVWLCITLGLAAIGQTSVPPAEWTTIEPPPAVVPDTIATITYDASTPTPSIPSAPETRVLSLPILTLDEPDTTPELTSLFGVTTDWLTSPTDVESNSEPSEPNISEPPPAELPKNNPLTPTALVTNVIDGDTIEIEGGERVRYIGIDTPESTTQHECYGEEAKARNRELVEGKRVTLVADAEDRDKYGRLLRYVYVHDTFVNRTLVQDGFATQLTISPNVAHAAEFRADVADAREQGRGLWSGCPEGEQNGSSDRSSATYDETVPQATVSECPTDKPIKGNAQSMIYHVPGGDFYAKTKPEACFATERDAETAGYRKSRR